MKPIRLVVWQHGVDERRVCERFLITVDEFGAPQIVRESAARCGASGSEFLQIGEGERWHTVELGVEETHE